MTYGAEPPACATCRRHECKNPECRWIGYRRVGGRTRPCPRCATGCHELLAQHRSGVCRAAEEVKERYNRERWLRYQARTVAQKGDEEEVNNAC